MKHYLTYSIPLEDILGNTFGTIKHLSEAVFDAVISWDCGGHVFKYGKDCLYGDYGVFEDALEVINKELNPPLSADELARHKDDIESDILRAMADAYRSNYENGIFEEVQDAVERWQDELQASGFYYLDINGKKCAKYEAAYVAFFYTKVQFNKAILPDALENGDIANKSALRDYVEREYCFEQWRELVDPNPINWEHFDYYGSRFDCEGWEEMLKEYAETPYTIKKEREAKKEKIKSMIKNRVPLVYRAQEVEAIA